MERNHLKGCPSVFDDDAIPCICKALRERPRHPDFERLAAAARRSDDEVERIGSSADYGEYLASRSGIPPDVLADMATSAGLEIAMLHAAKSKEGDGSLASCYLLGWVVGFMEARKKETGIDYSAEDDEDATDFCGADKKSVAYVANQRILRVAGSAVDAGMSEGDVKSIAAIIGSCWVDGYFVALGY